ncbi:hypothetical protein Ancab_019051 [Ancistrocladus abbreviatus]
MATSRIARFATEVAPQQIVSIMRRRAPKMLDTIHEDDRESNFDSMPATSKATSYAASSPLKAAALQNLTCYSSGLYSFPVSYLQALPLTLPSTLRAQSSGAVVSIPLPRI